MIRYWIRISILAAIVSAAILLAGPVQAETELMILVDASAEMAAMGEPGTTLTKFDEMKNAITALLQTLPDDTAVGLRAMGSSPSADCYSSYLYYPLGTGLRGLIQDYLDSIYPSGSRALLQGIEDGIGDFSFGEIGQDKMLLVITGGGDACGREFDTLKRNLANEPYPPHVVIYACNLNSDESEELGELAAITGGRLTSVQSTAGLKDVLVAFTQGLANNLRIHLTDSSGNAVDGDIVIIDYAINSVISEQLDISEYSMTVPPGSYQVIGRFLGQEVRTEPFTIASGSSHTASLEFTLYREAFIVTLRDIYGLPFRARVLFMNNQGDPVFTTELDSVHRVNLPPDNYTLEIRFGDYIETIYGVRIGPGLNNFLDYDLPVELATLEIEVTNFMGDPLNSKIQIFDRDGTLVDDAPFTSYLHSRVPPGEYRVVADYNGDRTQDTVFIAPGETRTIGLEINVDLGDIFVMLRTESGHDIWGWVQVYDSNGNLLERFDRERFESPDWFITSVPVGIYRIEAEAEGTVRTYSGVEVRSGEETEITITFPDELY
jgi:hypothetical protein